MSSAFMWWGSSDIPSGVPYGTRVSVTDSGLGLNVCGIVRGQGWVDLTFCARYYLGIQRMPADGIQFQSEPGVFFEGDITGLTGGGPLFNAPSAKCGLRLRQLVYSGDTCIGMTEKRYPRLINIDHDRNEYQNESLWGRRALPAFSWTLDRSKALHIDVKVRFRMYVEGSGEIWFDYQRVWGLTFEIPQWEILATSYEQNEDDDYDWSDRVEREIERERAHGREPR